MCLLCPVGRASATAELRRYYPPDHLPGAITFCTARDTIADSLRSTSMLSEQHATGFATTALGHVTREYPHKLDQVLTGPGDLQTPSALHPIFHGSFDWHSCVHAYWLLARLLRQYPQMPQADRIRALFAAALTPGNVAAEAGYLARPYAGGFERPYGWAWLLMLAAELGRHPEAGMLRGAAALAPLAEAFVQRFLAWQPKATYPIRSGVHANTA